MVEAQNVCHLLPRLPRELQLLVMNFIYLLQMQAAYSTDDLDEMARCITLCNWDEICEDIHVAGFPRSYVLVVE